MTDQRSGLSCNEAIIAVWDFLDEATDEALTIHIREHLAICPRCRDRFAFERTFIDSVEGLIEDTADVAPLRTRIEQALAEHGLLRPPKE